MLCARARDADCIGLLKRVIADQRGGDLTGQHDKRDRIHQRIGQTGHRIGCAGTGGDKHDPGLACCPRIAFRRMHGPLLMSDQHMLDFMIPLKQLIINWQNRATGIAEDHFYALILQRLDHDSRAGYPILSHHIFPIVSRRDICQPQAKTVLPKKKAGPDAGWP
jgi:hypothetical protein